MHCPDAWHGPNDEAERLTVVKNPETTITKAEEGHSSCQTFLVLQSGLIKLCMQSITSCLRTKDLCPALGAKDWTGGQKVRSPSIHQRSPGGTSFMTM